tara:strand:- start:1310 stop:1432 length:123 start_codon:yes stop_codon:yes gene_type:complete
MELGELSDAYFFNKRWREVRRRQKYFYTEKSEDKYAIFYF